MLPRVALPIPREQVTRHILARHDPWRCYERKEPQKKGRGGVRFLGNELLGLVSAPLSMEGEKVILMYSKPRDDLSFGA